MHKQPRLYISSADIISPAGFGVNAQLDALMSERCFLTEHEGVLQGRLSAALREELQLLGREKALKEQDPLIHLAVLLARQLKSKGRIPRECGVVFGSSRGPTERLEQSFISFQAGERLRALSSPTTTAGALPAAIARDLGLRGPSLFVSAACATGLHSVLQAAGSITLGLAPSMLAGAAEWANSAFTVAMLQAARVYAPLTSDPYPCKPGADERTGMILSEGAAALMIETDPWYSPLGELVGWGAGTESVSPTGVSLDAEALQLAIKQAMAQAELEPEHIDLIVGHGAGTKQGDAAELQAYAQLFPSDVPIVFHKWSIGHMLGASGAASLILGMHHLREGLVPPHPYSGFGEAQRWPRRLNQQRNLLVTSMGFGGNAAAVIVRNPAINGPGD